MNFDEFSIYSMADRLKEDDIKSPRAIKKIMRVKLSYELMRAKLFGYAEACEKEQKDCLDKVIASLDGLIYNAVFEPDSRDKEILKAAHRLIINRALFVDTKNRYAAMCEALSAKLESRRFNILSYENKSYRLTRREKQQRIKRLQREETDSRLCEMQKNIEEHNQNIAALNQQIEKKQKQILTLGDEQKEVGLMREINRDKVKIARERELIEASRRVIQLIEDERYQEALARATAQMDLKRQVKLIKEAQQIYYKQRLADEIIAIQKEALYNSQTPIKDSELIELRKLKSQNQMELSAFDIRAGSDINNESIVAKQEKVFLDENSADIASKEPDEKTLENQNNDPLYN